MSKTVKWGVVGCGGIAARRTIPEMLKQVEDVELVGVMNRTTERAKEIAAEFNVPFYTDSEEELLKQDIDAVYIATPQDVHCRQAIQCAEAGKHILCEKPIAISLEEVDQMEAAVKANNVKFMLGFCMRYNVYNTKAREIVQSGALGQLVMGRAELTCWYPPIPGAWRQNSAISHGGCLLDMGTHCLDMLEWIMGSTVVEVTGFQDMMTHKYRTVIEDSSTVLVRFANGAHGIIDNYFNLPDAAAQNSLEIHGTKGSLVGQGTIGQDPTGRMFSILQSEETGYDANQVRNVDVNREEYNLQGKGIYASMIEEFSNCVRNDSEPSISLADGRHSVKLCDAVYRAVKEKRIIEVEN